MMVAPSPPPSSPPMEWRKSSDKGCASLWERAGRDGRQLGFLDEKGEYWAIFSQNPPMLARSQCPARLPPKEWLNK